MHLTDDYGIDYINSIAKTLGDRIGLSIKADMKNQTKNSVKGDDSRKIGRSDIEIRFSGDLGKFISNDIYDDAFYKDWTLLKFNISEMPSCGIAVVNDLSIINTSWAIPKKELTKINIESIHSLQTIMDIFSTDEGNEAPNAKAWKIRAIYRDRYGLGKSLIFTGNNYENSLYQELGFIKSVAYNNTRYSEDSRHIYIYGSRKTKKEPVGKYTAAIRALFTKSNSVKVYRRSNSFISEVNENYKQLKEKRAAKEKDPKDKNKSKKGLRWSIGMAPD